MIKRIEGNKINLRLVNRSDARPIYQYAGDEDISRNTYIPHPYHLSDAYDFIKSTHSARRKKTGYHFGLENKENRQIIGMIGLLTINHDLRNGEIGYWLARPFWGRGIMSEAVRLMLGFCFAEVKLHRVHAHVFPFNKPSIHLLEKVGFSREGLLREAFVKDGDYVDCYIYSILEDEWARLGMIP